MKLVLAPIFVLIAVAAARPHHGSSHHSKSEHTEVSEHVDVTENIHEFFHSNINSINEKLTISISINASASLDVDASGLYNGKVHTQEDFDYELQETVHVAINTKLSTLFDSSFWTKADHDVEDAVTKFCDLSGSDVRSCIKSNLHDISNSVGKVYHSQLHDVQKHLEVNLNKYISDQIDASFKEKDIDFGFEKLSVNGKFKFSDTVDESVSIWVKSWDSDNGVTWWEDLETSMKEHISESDSESESTSH